MTPNLTAPIPTETPNQRLDRQLVVLREITLLSLRLARRAAAEAEALPPEPNPAAKPRPSTNPRQIFERLARAIRANIALEIRLTGRPAPDAKTAPPEAEPPPADDPSLTAQDDLALLGRLSRHDRRALAKRLRTTRG